jgi:lipopolysaccharide/colanic/teichoic acid biosynthesis glycosyltransferase
MQLPTLPDARPRVNPTAPSSTLLRAVDLAFTVLLAPIWAPLLLLGVVVAALGQGLPVFYPAERLGQGGKVFRMLKLRTMVRSAERLGPAVSASDDPRVTKAGRILRRTKLDEIPQFLHVLSGRMSIVGPRPESPVYLPHYTPAGLRALDAKPGLTGYGTLYFFSAERSAPTTDFENRYIRDLLPTKLLLDERCWLDLQVRPFRTTLSLVVLTLGALIQSDAARFAPAQLEDRFLRQGATARTSP